MSYESCRAYSSSAFWEGLFIDISGGNFSKHITLGNIYRPPKLNNNDLRINAELNEICKWFSSNKLFLNAPKTKYMLFHFPQGRITDIDLTLKINDLHIDRVHEFNFLGTIIHETLEWTRHIDKVANKISRTLGILNKLKHILPIYTLKTMYSALLGGSYDSDIYVLIGSTDPNNLSTD